LLTKNDISADYNNTGLTITDINMHE